MKNRITKLAIGLALLVAACDVPPEQQEQQNTQPVELPKTIDASKPWSHKGVVGLPDDVDVAALVSKRLEDRARLMALPVDQQGVEAIHQGVHCNLDLPPFGCQDWAPDTLPGFVVVASNYVPANNEYMMCDYLGHCQKCAMGAGGFYNIGNLVDWSANSYYVKAIKSQMHGSQAVYQNVNWGGSSWGWSGAITLSNVPGTTGYKINSVTIAN